MKIKQQEPPSSSMDDLIKKIVDDFNSSSSDVIACCEKWLPVVLKIDYVVMMLFQLSFPIHHLFLHFIIDSVIRLAYCA
jgi:hypothetical protein